MPVSVGLALVVILGAPDATHDPGRMLARAVALVQNFDDAKAEPILRELLRHSPSRPVAGRAHLYLGIIAMNAVDTERAMEEFKKALLIEPALDFVRGGSPKARLAFEEARHALEGQLRSEEPEAQPPLASRAGLATPASAAPLDPYAESSIAAREPRSGHALAITLGAVGLVALGVGVYGGVDLLDYNSSVSTANAGTTTPFTSQLQSSRSQAGFWAVAWIPFVVAGALGLGAGALTW